MTEKNIEKDVRDAFFDKIYELASKDENLIFITADAGAFSLQRFKKDFPERFINVGVAEQTMVLLATGLAMTGKNVFIYSIIPFITQRALEHIKVNIDSMNLPVTIIGCGAGLSFGFDGPTHHGTQDIAAMNSLPRIKIISPCDATSSMKSAEYAYHSNSPCYIRLDKGVHEKIYNNDDDISMGMKLLLDYKKYLVISTGFMTQNAYKVCKILSNKYKIGLLDVGLINSFDQKEMLKIIKSAEKIFVIEEHSKVGGLSSIISNFIIDNNIKNDLHKISLPNEQIFQYGNRDWILDNFGLSIEKIIKFINNKIKKG